MPTAETKLSRVITKEELCLLQPVPASCGIVIFGASGDLAHRKLYPALAGLDQEKFLPKSYYVLGVARSKITDNDFQKGIEKALSDAKVDADKEFVSHCAYHSGDYNDPKTYKDLKDRLAALDKQYGTPGNYLFYLSVPPELYAEVAKRLGEAGLLTPKNPDLWARLIVEKPFGYSEASARELNKALGSVMKEDQIYRIDHYLGKETVQNILMFRFANIIYEPIWNRKYIDHIQITAAETVGVEHRGGYYEKAGATRDMFQNHLFQLLSVVTMEPPCAFTADAVRDEKAKVMNTLRPLKPEDLDTYAVRAQYAAGTMEGKPAPAYRAEEGVSPTSTTETYAALSARIDNWRWEGVPFYLRTGKRLPKRQTEIIVQFKHVPTSIFKPLLADQVSPNVLNFHIQPDEGISLGFEAKHPGPKLCMSSVMMKFDYAESFGVKPPEAYSRLFLDVMLGDQMLFARPDWQYASWAYLDPLLNRWAEQKDKGLVSYASGSWGPKEADALLEREGRRWLM